MPEHRRFPIVDGMILVGALAAGFAATRLALVPYGERWGMRSATEPWFLWGVRWTIRWLTTAAPCVAAISVAIIVLNLRAPRPPRRRLFRRAGLQAAVVSSLGLVACSWPVFFVLQLLRGMQRQTMTWETQVIVAGLGNGTAVLGVWVVTRSAGAVRCERHWLDRAGRAVGLFWVIFAIVISFAVTMEIF